jgi:hypothetical protein
MQSESALETTWKRQKRKRNSMLALFALINNKGDVGNSDQEHQKHFATPCSSMISI